MPIVVSYDDIAAMGEAAYAGGYSRGAAGSRDRMEERSLQNTLSQREATAAAQRLRYEQRRDDLDRQLEAQLAAMHQQGDQAEREARLQRAMMEAGLDVQADRQDFRQQLTRDRLRHGYEMQQIDRRAEHDSRRKTNRPTLPEAGAPGDKWVEQAIRKHAGEIPFVQGDATRGQVEARYKIAGDLASLPDEQLRAELDSDPKGEWARFIQALLQDREQARSASSDLVSRSGGPRPSHRPHAGGGGHTGSANGYENLSDAELLEAARRMR